MHCQRGSRAGCRCPEPESACANGHSRARGRTAAGPARALDRGRGIFGEFAPGSVVGLVDVRHPERLIGRGSVALSSRILLLLRALSSDDVAGVISMLFRMRHSLAARDHDSPKRAAMSSRIICPDEFEDSSMLANSSTTAARQALAQLRTFSLDTVIELTDSLMLSQPRLCAAILLDGSFRLGRLAPDSAVRRAARDIHAIHRDSLVVYSGN